MSGLVQAKEQNFYLLKWKKIKPKNWYHQHEHTLGLSRERLMTFLFSLFFFIIIHLFIYVYLSTFKSAF